MVTVFCLDCGSIIDLDPKTKAGQRLTCRHCRTELELINASPPELDWAYDGPDTLRGSWGWDWEGDEEAVGQGERVR
jgi:hypothetical protein